MANGEWIKMANGEWRMDQAEFCAKKRRTIREKGINNLTARQKYGMFSIDEHTAQNGKAPRIRPWATAGD
jgi:hypothetical protein